MVRVNLKFLVIFVILSFVSVVGDPRPKVLIIGESRVQQFSPYAIHSSSPYVADAQSLPNGAFDYLFGTDPRYGDSFLNRWKTILNPKWDIIYFTYGLDEASNISELSPADSIAREAQFVNQMNRFIDSVRQHNTDVQLLFHNQVPVDSPTGAGRRTIDVKHLNNLSREICQQHNIPYHDIYKVSNDSNLVRTDGRHYDFRGKRIQGEAAASFITSFTDTVADVFLKKPVSMASDLSVVTIGSNVSHPWKVPPESQGGYIADGVYQLSGNGNGVYWCSDLNSFAYHSLPVSEPFLFMARMKSTHQYPVLKFGMTGLLARRSLAPSEPVLSLRWDYFWDEAGGNAMRWFNRITPGPKASQEEKGLCENGNCHPICSDENPQANCWNVCWNEGLENGIGEIDKKENVWMAIEGIPSGGGKMDYNLYVKEENASQWIQVNPNSSNGLVREVFELPPGQNGNQDSVYVGFFVSGGQGGMGSLTSQFDQISLYTGSQVPGDLPVSIGGRQQPFHPRQSEIQVRMIGNQVEISHFGTTAQWYEFASIDGQILARLSGNGEDKKVISLLPLETRGPLYLSIKTEDAIEVFILPVSGF